VLCRSIGALHFGDRRGGVGDLFGSHDPNTGLSASAHFVNTASSPSGTPSSRQINRVPTDEAERRSPPSQAAATAVAAMSVAVERSAPTDRGVKARKRPGAPVVVA